MDVTSIIATEQSKQKSIVVEKEISLDVDPGLLAVTDSNPLDYSTYKENKEDFLQLTARDACQVLITSLFSLPVESTPDGPLAKLPEPKLHLPRAKPLPKPKPPTKWERFAAAKGIQKVKRDKKVFDEEKQEWVNRWGRGGKNHETEEQWLTVLPSNAGKDIPLFFLPWCIDNILDADYDPIKASRTERRTRVAKNEKQRQRNLEHANKIQPPSSSLEDRKRSLEKTIAVSRLSTASMGKFDKQLEGEKKLRGIKRKFEPNEVSAEQERKSSLAIASSLNKKSEHGSDGVLNVRKAIRTLNKEKGSSASAGHSRGKKLPARGKTKTNR